MADKPEIVKTTQLPPKALNAQPAPEKGTAVPVREQILKRGIELTIGDRYQQYGSPIDNLGLAGKIKELCHAASRRSIGPAEREALDLCITKFSRLFVGSSPGRDTYTDLATYAAIAGEVAEAEASQTFKS